MPTIEISVSSITLRAELNQGETAARIWDVLPVKGRAVRWGEEIYFEIPVAMAEESDARQNVEVGTLAYWPPGRAFCIFFGPTPASSDERPRAYSPVNVVGKMLDDVDKLREVQSGASVCVERA
jgi:hypothetical protein